MPDHLGQEPLDCHGHQFGATETGHVRKDVGRVEPLAGDVEFELFRQSNRHVVEDLSGQFVLAKELLVTLDGARRHFNTGLQVQGILDVTAEDVSLGGLLGGPVEKVGHEDQAGHRIQFLGGGSQFPAEMLGQFTHGHQFEEDVSKDSLPARADYPLTGARYDTVEWVKEAALSRVDDVDHGGRNSFCRGCLSVEVRLAEVKGEMDIKSDLTITCAEN